MTVGFHVTTNIYIIFIAGTILKINLKCVKPVHKITGLN